MLKTFKKGMLTAAAAVLGAALLGGCSSGTRASDGLVHLNFQIWDNAQRGGMEAVARAYMDKNPEVEIQVQVTSWDEYWTKLDAAGETGGAAGNLQDSDSQICGLWKTGGCDGFI